MKFKQEYLTKMEVHVQENSIDIFDAPAADGDEDENNEANNLNNDSDLTIGQHIDQLCEMDIDKAKSNGKISGISLKKLQEMAVHMSIPKSQPKGKLVDAIREKIL